MARDFDVLYVSGRVNIELGIDKFVWLHFESVQQGENTHEHLWFPILNSAFKVQTIISYCLITIPTKTCSFAIFNSVILLNLMSDSPVLVPQRLN